VTKPHPEGFEGIGPLTITDEYDGSAFEVEDNGDIAVTFLYCDLIDGQIPHVFEYRPGELLLEVPLLDILDDIPRHMEMTGHIKDRHMLREFKDIPLEGSGIREAGIGKAKINLTNRLTVSTRNPLYVQVQINHFRSYGYHAEASGRTSSQNKIPAPADRTMKLIPLVLDGKNYLASLVYRSHIGVADQTESVVQQACGQASPPVEMRGCFSP